MKRAILLGIILLAQTSWLSACSCGVFVSFCAYQHRFTHMVLAKTDSFRSDSLGVYLTVIEPLKGSLSAGTQFVLEDDTNDVCFLLDIYQLSYYYDTAIFPLSLPVDTDTAGRQVFRTNLNWSCSGGDGWLVVRNDSVYDVSWNEIEDWHGSLKVTYAEYKSILLSGDCPGTLTGVAEPVRPVANLIKEGYSILAQGTASGGFSCYNMAGQMVAGATGTQLALDGLGAGIYIVSFTNQQGTVTQKFFVE